MPTANDEDIELLIPAHPCLRLDSVCVQAFNKWSRRLLTYRRLRDDEVPAGALEAVARREYEKGTKASDLNDFRRKYFQGFREFEDMKKEFIRMKVEAGAEKAGEERGKKDERGIAEEEKAGEKEAVETSGQTQS
jgi:tRNA (guanine10-N2)-methyltransferase